MAYCNPWLRGLFSVWFWEPPPRITHEPQGATKFINNYTVNHPSSRIARKQPCRLQTLDCLCELNLTETGFACSVAICRQVACGPVVNEKLNRVCMFGPQAPCPHIGTVQFQFQFSFSCSFTTGPQATCPHIGTEHANPVSFVRLQLPGKHP